jgi:hypothetical protein
VRTSRQRRGREGPVRQTGRAILANVPTHKRVLVVGNQFGEFDVWDLDFWEMYNW